MTIGVRFYFSTSFINPRMNHIMAVTQKDPKIITIQLTQSPNERIVNIRIIMAISICQQNKFKGCSVRPFSKLLCSIGIIILMSDAICYNRQHTSTLLLFLISRGISCTSLSFCALSRFINLSFTSPPISTFNFFNRHIKLTKERCPILQEPVVSALQDDL